MISLKRFMALRAGDLVQMKSGLVRTIVEGPVDMRSKGLFWAKSVVLPIHNRSWTGRGTTTYGWNDIGDKIKRVIGRTRRICLKAELVRLKHIKIDPIKAIRREAKDAVAFSQRMGRPICAKAVKWSQL